MSLVNTLMQSLRSKYTNRFDKNELRESRYGALRAFQNDSLNPIFDPETVSNIKRSYGNSVVVPVLDAETISLSAGYARTCALVDAENTSQLVTLTFAVYGWGFSMTPSTHWNNDVKYQADFDRKMDKYLIQFASVLDTLCVTQLEADKNQVWTNIAPDYYAETLDALQVPQLDKNDFYNQIESIMNTADFYDVVNVIVATSGMPMVRRLEAPGSYKAFEMQNVAGAENVSISATGSNEAWSLRGMEWFPTNRIANSAGVEATGYAVEKGTLFISNRNDPDAIAGHNIGNFKVWDEAVMPIVNLNMGTYYQEDCGDRSAIGGAATAGNTRSKVEGFEFSTDIVVATTYNSDITTLYNPIMKFEILV